MNKILKWRQISTNKHKSSSQLKRNQPKSTVTLIKLTKTGSIIISKKKKIHISMDPNTKIKNNPTFSIKTYQLAGFLAVTVIRCLKKFRVITSLLDWTAKSQRINLLEKISKWTLWAIEFWLLFLSNKSTNFNYIRNRKLQRNLTKNIFRWCLRVRMTLDVLK